MTHREFRPLLLKNEFNVREVKFPDLEKVKVITKDPYGGMDYTNSVLKQWLADDRWYLFCVETNTGQIIGFTALNLIDNKKNVVVRSSRIAHDFRSKGIYKAMLNFALAEVKKNFPSLENIFRQRMVDIRIPVGYTCQKLITEIALQCDTEKANSLRYPKNLEALFSNFEETKISFKELANRYKTDELLRSLYPMNLLTIEGEVFDITEESNITYLQSRKEILVSFSKCLSASNVVKMAVSILNLEPKQTDEGVPCANLDVQSNDVTMATYHLQRALNVVASVMRNAKFNLNFLFNFQHEKEITEFIKKELLCCKVVGVFKMHLLRGSFSEET
eukprot:Seg169.19 transcript_id=Seg169.19/GoldUCD/mRNA.D3Y31 product="Histidine N-acetyltransferase" protein_id=Seg169.19/GoldUCD/D3Y31